MSWRCSCRNSRSYHVVRRHRQASHKDEATSIRDDAIACYRQLLIELERYVSRADGPVVWAPPCRTRDTPALSCNIHERVFDSTFTFDHEDGGARGQAQRPAMVQSWLAVFRPAAGTEGAECSIPFTHKFQSARNSTTLLSLRTA